MASPKTFSAVPALSGLAITPVLSEFHGPDAAAAHAGNDNGSGNGDEMDAKAEPEKDSTAVEAGADPLLAEQTVQG